MSRISNIEYQADQVQGQDFATVDRKSQETIKGQVEMRLQDLLAGTPKCFIDLYGYDADADEPPANPADPSKSRYDTKVVC